LREKFNRSHRHDGRHFHDRRIHLAVGKYRDGTFVPGRIRVVVNQLMKIGTRRHCVQQQDQTDQQRGENRLAGSHEMSDFQLQAICF